MIKIRAGKDRGHADHGWLLAKHSFSFAAYHDPEEMGWGALRVINEDRVKPGKGFGMHGHRDMEIVTYILAGVLEHRDSLGNGGVIRRGEVQRMSAGRGILHSEFNPSVTEETHLLQIWIEPAAPGGQASYEQLAVAGGEVPGPWRCIASPDGAQGSTTIGQDAHIHVCRLEPQEAAGRTQTPGRLGYLHVVRGRVRLNGIDLAGGDAAKLADEPRLEIVAGEASEILYFDLPPPA